MGRDLGAPVQMVWFWQRRNVACGVHELFIYIFSTIVIHSIKVLVGNNSAWSLLLRTGQIDRNLYIGAWSLQFAESGL